MDGGLEWSLLVIVFGLGFFFGRIDWQTLRRDKLRVSLRHFWGRRAYPSAYLLGLNQLLAGRQDAAIDTFLDTLPVTDRTLETHFALGCVLRRRGQLERAIRIHQNILDAPGLEPEVTCQAQLELALDYDASGLFDRAEALLTNLEKTATGHVHTQALKCLVELFEKEGEWQQALTTAERLCERMSVSHSPHWRHLQAHYCCELAEASGDEVAGQRFLQQGRQFCADHARVALMEAEGLLFNGQPGRALQKLQVLLNSKRYLQVGVPLMLRSFALQQTDDLARQELVDLFRQHNEPALVPMIARRIYMAEGGEVMLQFVKSALKDRDLHYSDLLSFVRPTHEECDHLLSILDRELRFTFVCDHCGFRGEHWHWCCPACRSWL